MTMLRFISPVVAAGLSLLCSAVAAAGEIPSVTMELAPKELGSFQGNDLLLATRHAGREVLLFDPELGLVETFQESGYSWGDPLPIRESGYEISPSRMAAGDGILVFSAGDGVFAFEEDGQLVGRHKIFQPSDVVPIPGGRVAVSLTNLPHPMEAGKFLARAEFGEEVPRVALYDSDFGFERAGLLEEGEVTSTAGAARSLLLTRGGKRIFAAEKGAYRIYELDYGLDLVEVYSDPELDFLEPDEDAKSSAANQLGEAIESEEAFQQRPGRNLGAAPASEPEEEPRLVAISSTNVIRDVAWGSAPGQLYILVEPGSLLSDHAAVDVLDTTSGTVRRSRLERPDGIGEEVTLTQIAAGRRYLWMRGYQGPTFRVDRMELDLGEEIPVPRTLRGAAIEDPPFPDQEDGEGG